MFVDLFIKAIIGVVGITLLFCMSYLIAIPFSVVMGIYSEIGITIVTTIIAVTMYAVVTSK